MRKLIIFILAFGVLCCDNSSNEQDMDLDCVPNTDILFNSEMFEDCPAEAIANLCSNMVCFDMDDVDFNFIIPSDGCTNFGCIDITCNVNEVVAGSPFLGVAELNLSELAGPSDSDLFSGTGSIDMGNLFNYNCVTVVE